jgi:hypothetical protein
LLAQEKVTKEKGTPEGAVGLWPTARGRCGGSLTGHPWPDSELAGILPATLRAFSSATSPRPRGTPKSKAKHEFTPMALIRPPGTFSRKREKGMLFLLPLAGEGAEGG